MIINDQDLARLRRALELSEGAVFDRKHSEYCPEGHARAALQQFHDIGKLEGRHPAEVAYTMLLKHIHGIGQVLQEKQGGAAGVYPGLWSWQDQGKEGFLQKIADCRNYLLFIAGAVMEDQEGDLLTFPVVTGIPVEDQGQGGAWKGEDFNGVLGSVTVSALEDMEADGPGEDMEADGPGEDMEADGPGEGDPIVVNIDQPCRIFVSQDQGDLVLSVEEPIACEAYQDFGSHACSGCPRDQFNDCQGTDTPSGEVGWPRSEVEKARRRAWPSPDRKDRDQRSDFEKLQAFARDWDRQSKQEKSRRQPDPVCQVEPASERARLAAADEAGFRELEKGSGPDIGRWVEEVDRVWENGK